MSTVKHVSQTTFSTEVLHSPVPVLVDFYADWCGPCRRLVPTLEKLAAEFQGQARIVKVNVDTEPELAGQFQVESIPTLVLLVDGRPVRRTTGLAPEASLRQALHQVTASTRTARPAV